MNAPSRAHERTCQRSRAREKSTREWTQGRAGAVGVALNRTLWRRAAIDGEASGVLRWSVGIIPPQRGIRMERPHQHDGTTGHSSSVSSYSTTPAGSSHVHPELIRTIAAHSVLSHDGPNRPPERAVHRVQRRARTVPGFTPDPLELGARNRINKHPEAPPRARDALYVALYNQDTRHTPFGQQPTRTPAHCARATLRSNGATATRGDAVGTTPGRSTSGANKRATSHPEIGPKSAEAAKSQKPQKQAKRPKLRRTPPKPGRPFYP